MKNESNRMTVAVLALFAVFAVAILGVLLGGAGVYRRLTRENSRHDNGRTAISYLAAKLRQASAPEAVQVGQFGDGQALLLTEDLDGSSCLTRIYCHDGWLMELFTLDEEGFSPEDGEKILPAESLHLAWSGELLTVEVTCEGVPWSVCCAIRGKEVSP